MACRSPKRFVRCLEYLIVGATLCVQFMPLVAQPSSMPQSPPAAGVLAAVRGEVAIDRPGGARPLAGAVGMRLMPGDGLRVGPGSSATVYLAGGSIVRVPAGSRMEIPEGSPAADKAPPAPVGGISSRSVEVLERGLWVLNDPEGSVLLSGMRGEDDAWDEAGRLASQPLSPRFEIVLDARPRFVWGGTDGPVRVALARGKEILWRSTPTQSSFLRLEENGPKLRAGEAYRWWLEAADGGGPLGEAVPFRVADKEVQGGADRFESEIKALVRGNDDDALAGLLRCGYYVQVGAWSRVLAAAADLQRRDANSPVAARALDGCRRQMRLSEEGVASLAKIGEKQRFPGGQ
ncbi:MAG TPA: hypothetical protein VKF61_08350 [Candidatus Polarisedimenticolia bacterium]|nr:hypothetical protein [Candidatus Polarisedimenticolia bacterium]